MGSIYVPSTPADVGVVSASESAAGIVELATAAEVLTGTDSGRVPSVASVANGLGVARREVRTTGAIAETIPWCMPWVASSALTSGRLYMCAIMLPSCVVSNVSFLSMSTALTTGSSPHLWFALYDASRNLLGQSADDTSPSWATYTLKTKPLSAPVSVSAGLHYVAFCVVCGSGGAMMTMASIAAQGLLVTPARSGYADSSLTDTAPNPAAAITVQSSAFHGNVS